MFQQARGGVLGTFIADTDRRGQSGEFAAYRILHNIHMRSVTDPHREYLPAQPIPLERNLSEDLRMNVFPPVAPATAA
jgi:hypothetical protein